MPQQPRKKPVWLWAGIIGVIVIALVVAILSTRGVDTTVTEGTTATNDSGNSASSAAEIQPVTVTGTPLPQGPNSGGDALANGLTPPTLSGFHFDGSPMEIAPGGRAKMVVFLAHWCPHCNREIPVLQSWAAAGGVPANLDIVGISTGVREGSDNYPPSKWLVDRGWEWPVMADSAEADAAIAYGLSAYPTFVIVGADGKVKARSTGELPAAELDAIVTEAVAA